MFVLPNLFTLSSIFCGFYAMTLCAGDASPTLLYQAALAILEKNDLSHWPVNIVLFDAHK